MPELSAPLRTLALKLFEIGAIKCDDYYRLKLHEKNPEAPLSPIFLNLRTSVNPKPGPLTPEIVADIAKIMFDYANEAGLMYDFVAPLPNAADPIAEAFARLIPEGEEKILYLTKEQEGGKRKIGGLKKESREKVFPGATALMMDDLCTEADSKLEGAISLENDGLIVYDIIVFVDREQGGREKLEEECYELHAMMTLSQMLQLYREEGLIGAEKFAEIRTYLDVSR